MRPRFLIILIALATAATTAMAKDVFLSIGGSVGVFRTDARIFNPSTSKDIQVQATFLPVGNTDNSAATAVTITVPKRQMAIYDDVVSSLLHSSGLGAIRLSSADDFVATQRIYGQTSSGTLGQFVPGLDATTATKNGVLVQLKSSSAFRTNLGAVNPNATAANVTWRLYDRNNALVATGTPIVMPPFAVLGPTAITSGVFFNASGFDLSDAWVSYASDQAIFAYGSVVDSGTTDPTFVPASNDSGGTPATTPSAQAFDVAVASFSITVTPSPNNLKVGDQVTFHVHAVNAGHGFELEDPNGQVIIPDKSGSGFKVGDAFDQTLTIGSEGTFTYFCTHPTCGSGHNSMIGTFTVGAATDNNGGRY